MQKLPFLLLLALTCIQSIEQMENYVEEAHAVNCSYGLLTSCPIRAKKHRQPHRGAMFSLQLIMWKQVALEHSPGTYIQHENHV